MKTIKPARSATLNVGALTFVVALLSLALLSGACGDDISGEPCLVDELNTFRCGTGSGTFSTSASTPVFQCQDTEVEGRVWKQVDSCPENFQCTVGFANQSFTCDPVEPG